MLTRMKKKANQKGFSLLEVLVFITILNIVFVAAISLIIGSLYRMQINIHKQHATFYAEELKEWLNSEREVDWIGLQAKTGNTYCVNTQLNLQSTFSNFTTGTCTYSGIGSNNPRIFRRQLTLTQTSSTQIAANIDVSWNEAAPNGSIQQYNQTIKTIYTAWQ
ncbi:hypothetical protein BH09PAT2_BH09PAT2_09450 [soil metagenome]